MTTTPLDVAHSRMESSGSDNDRLHFFERLSTAELFLLLEHEADGTEITPKLFPVDEHDLVLAFDKEERLTELAGPSPFVAMSGRQLIKMLAGQGPGLGLNLDVAPSSFLLDAEGVNWLAETLERSPETGEARPDNLHPPSAVPESLLQALDSRLAASAGLARSAYLCGVTYKQGGTCHLLAFIDAIPEAQDQLARSMSEALVFSGIEAGSLDVAFFDASDPVAAKLATVGLRFDLPQPTSPTVPSTPGSNPDKPPILKG